jgi:hypothetical protein
MIASRTLLLFCDEKGGERWARGLAEVSTK